jgi:hypothetical protein
MTLLATTNPTEKDEKLLAAEQKEKEKKPFMLYFSSPKKKMPEPSTSCSCDSAMLDVSPQC